MRDLAVIAKIQDLAPIEGKDRIELATVENYTVIVEKGKHKVGDLVVYVFYETVLPIKEEFEFLRPRCYNKLYNGFRIKAMKMGGVYSNGIVFSLDILPKDLAIKEGLDVGEILGIVKYSPEDFNEGTPQVNYGPIVRYLLKYKIFRKLIKKRKDTGLPYPDTVEKSNEINIQKIYAGNIDNYSKKLFYITEKLEGQSATYMLVGKRREYRVYSHNVQRNIKGTGNWEVVGRKLNIAKLLKKQKSNFAIQGEIVGPGIQKNIYNLKELKFYVFKVTNTNTGESLTYYDLVEFCKKNGLDMVPDLGFSMGIPFSLEDTLKKSDGKSVLNKDVLREGVVYRSVVDNSIGFKVKSREYAVWFEKGKG